MIDIVSAIITTAVTWKTVIGGVVILGVTFGLAPGLLLNIAVLIFPKCHPRRAELINELKVVPFFQRALWVFSALGVTVTEGLPARVRSIRADRAQPAEAKLDADRAEAAPDANEPDEDASPVQAHPLTRIGKRSIMERLTKRLDTRWATTIGVSIASMPLLVVAMRSGIDDVWRGASSGAVAFAGLAALILAARRERNAVHRARLDLTITTDDVRAALGPDADHLMAQTDVDVDELVRRINIEIATLPILPDPPAGRLPTGQAAGGEPPD